MKTRGLTSRAALSVVPHSVVEIVDRPGPPDELSDEQAAEWRAVVDRLPADWFPRETHGLLVAYCRHVVTLRRIGQMISAAENDRDTTIEDFDKLYRMQEREGRAMSSLATRMRVSQQSTMKHEQARKPAPARRPHDF